MPTAAVEKAAEQVDEQRVADDGPHEADQPRRDVEQRGGEAADEA